MKIFIFLFLTFQIFDLYGQRIISNLSFSGCFVGTEEKVQVSELNVSFEIDNSDDVEIIYLQYGYFNEKLKDIRFKLFDFRQTRDSDVVMEPINEELDRVIMIIPILKNIELINCILVYISDKSGVYSNRLRFCPNL